MNKRGLLVIISGPSGAGKGTVVNVLKKDKSYCLSISVTTRKPRCFEIDKVHYFFKTEEEFNKMIENNEFLEYAKFCNNCYGTPASYVLEQIDKGKNVILEIEVQGALQVKEKFPDAILIFLTPPNINELRQRLVNRATEDDFKINMRMKRALEEFDIIDKYDYIVINKVVKDAVSNINTIVNAEKMKASRNIDLKMILKGEIN